MQSSYSSSDRAGPWTLFAQTPFLRGSTVGQPTRGRPSHYGDMLSLKLPNSGIVCTISHKKIARPDTSKDSEDTLYPDVGIWPTFEDYLNGADPVFDWVLKDAKKKSPSIN